MSTKIKTFLDDKTYLPVSLILVMLSAAISFGVMYNEVKQLQIQVDKMESKLEEIVKVVYRLDARDMAETNNLRTVREN